MLRNRFGWAWRRFVAFLLLFLFCIPTARGGPLIGLPPILPVIPGGSQPPPQTQSVFSLSGYVYNDATAQGVMLPGDTGVSAVQMTLLQNSSAGLQTFTAFTNSAGYYTFSGLTAGDNYTIEETQPANFLSTADNVGYFQTASGGTLAVPPGASLGTLSPPNAIAGITFEPSSAGTYSAANYNFGESAVDYVVYGIPGKPVIPGGTRLGPSASLSVSLAVVGTNDRFLAGAGAGSLNVTGTLLNTGAATSSAFSWNSSTSVGLNLSPTSGANLAPATPQILTGTVNGTDLGAGPQYATVTVSGRIGTNGKLTSETGSVLVDPVFSRGIDSVSTANLGRIMAGATTLSQPLTITSTGAYANYSNLTLNGGASAAGSDSSGDTFSVANSAAVTYNGTTTSNSGNSAFSGKFSSSTSGPVSGTATIPGNTGLFTGETLASGTPTLPTLSVPYTATVLQQRQLSAGPTFSLPVPAGNGGLLSGATVPVPTGYTVLSTTDSNHTTSVYVNGSALALYSTNGVSPYQPPVQVGEVNVTQTLVNSAGATTVPVSVLVQALGPYTAIASLNVVTAENASVQDTNPYAPVNLAFSVTNVGYAATGGSNSTGVQQLGAPLSAPFTAGSRLAAFSSSGSTGNFTYTGVPLTSIVASAGNAGSNSTTTGYNGTTLTDPYNPTSNVYGAVGSQFDILDSTALASTANVTMAWRDRNTVENGLMVSSSTEKLPAGIKWLTSDVVDVEGVPAGTVFAAEMSFDDDINSVLEHPATPTTIAGSYLAKLVTTGSVSTWENAALTLTAGSLAEEGVADSLSDFLASEYAANALRPVPLTHDQLMAALAGSWGVDLIPGGVGTSWAIVNSDGQYAVVPEPGILALLGTALAGLLVYRVRRRAPGHERRA